MFALSITSTGYLQQRSKGLDKY